MVSIISSFPPGSLCVLNLGKKQLIRLIWQWRRQCSCTVKVSNGAQTVGGGCVGVFSAEGALSAVQSKKTSVSSRGAIAPGGPAFLSASAASSVQATDVAAKQRWGLNEEQLAAVEADTAYVRVVAGPGSGKTRVLTHRIAHMIDQLKAPPCNILCVTFTNKAAQELCERLNNLLDEDVSSQLMVGTIHSVCARILRSSPQICDYSLNGNYIIYDENNSQQVVKRILQEDVSYLA